MSLATIAPLASLAGLALVAAVLRTLALARRADDAAVARWRDLTLLQSASGIAFFPTAEARLELELELTEAIELERRPAGGPVRAAGRAWYAA